MLAVVFAPWCWRRGRSELMALQKKKKLARVLELVSDSYFTLDYWVSVPGNWNWIFVDIYRGVLVQPLSLNHAKREMPPFLLLWINFSGIVPTNNSIHVKIWIETKRLKYVLVFELPINLIWTIVCFKPIEHNHIVGLCETLTFIVRVHWNKA